MILGAPTSIRVLSVFLLIPLRCMYAGALASNRTIDDEFGDSVTGQKPVFLPTTGGIWEGQECAGCRVQPNRDIAFKGTWNAATFRPEARGSGPLSIDLSFTGTAIYIFFITANKIEGGLVTTLTECNFTLDGQHAGFFQHIPTDSTDMQYNVLGFSRQNMQNTDHTVRISTRDVGYHVFVNFDYAIYTFDNVSTSSSASVFPPNEMPSPTISTSPSPLPPSQIDNLHNERLPLGAIVGGILGFLTLILLATVVLCHYRNKNSRKAMLKGSLAAARSSTQKIPYTTISH